MKYFEYRRYRRRLKLDKALIFCFIVAIIYVVSFIKSNNIPPRKIIIAVILVAMVFGVFYIGYHHVKKRIYLSSPMSKIDKMQGIQFEEYLKCLFEEMGYKVNLTPDTGDFGADLVCRKEGISLIVQAKRYSSSVGVASVQEVAAAKKYYCADDCMVVTNSYFTAAAKELAEANDVVLLDRRDLEKLIRTHRKKS